MFSTDERKKKYPFVPPYPREGGKEMSPIEITYPPREDTHAPYDRMARRVDRVRVDYAIGKEMDVDCLLSYTCTLGVRKPG